MLSQYLLPGVLFLISLLAQPLQIIYGIIYFYFAINTILGVEKVDVDPQHSSVTHYQRNSRWNWINYGLSAYIIISALLFAFVPISKAIIVLVSWCGFIYFQQLIGQRIFDFQLIELAGNYLVDKYPEIDDQKIKQFLEVTAQNPDMKVADLSEKLELPQDEVEALKYSLEKYEQQINHENSKDVPTATN